MRQVYILVGLLAAVVGGIVLLRNRAAERAGLAGKTAASSRADGGKSKHAGYRIIALTKLVPRYRVTIPSADPAKDRSWLVKWLRDRKGQLPKKLPANPRAPMVVEVPPKWFKPLLRDLRMDKRPIQIRRLPPRPVQGTTAPIQLHISFPK